MKQDNIILALVAVAIIAVIWWQTYTPPVTGAVPNDPAPLPETGPYTESGLTYLTSNAPYSLNPVNPIMPYATASATIPNGNQVGRYGGRFS